LTLAGQAGRTAEGEMEVAVLLAGTQREQTLVAKLIPLAQPKGGELPRLARRALGQIGTAQALRALEELIGKGRSELDREIVYLLGDYGDDTSLELLGRLAEDDSRPRADQYRFGASYDRLRERLGKKKADKR
jgi:hypothetical protein